eukprot:scaffold8398_cov25-Phaeocystis_antarctica.AAC.1
MADFCLVEGLRGGSRRKGAGKGPRPRPATTPMKAHAQLRFDAQRARLVMILGRVRDVIVKDIGPSRCDWRTPKYRLRGRGRPETNAIASGVHVFSIFPKYRLGWP